MAPKPESKKCPNCGACSECGAGGPPQFVPMPYPVYPPYPRPIYPGTNPYAPRWINQPQTWGIGVNQSSGGTYTQTWNNAGGTYQ